MALDRDRFVGAVVGLAVGDALGTTVEFRPPGTFPPVTDLVGGGPFGLPAGAWTDDTSMALCLAESLVERGGHDPADQLARYVRWWTEGHWSSTGVCVDIGGTTRAALDRFRRTGAVTDDPVDEEAAANGSLMRLAPAALRFAADPNRAGVMGAASSRTTHPARRPVDACRVLATMIAAAVGGAARDEVLDPARFAEVDLHPEIRRVVAGSYRVNQPPAIRGSGYCVDALEAALWAVHRSRGYRAAVLAAVNLGDDADTTGAICGQLAGALWGRTGIPAGWVDRVVRLDEILELTDRLWVATTTAEP